MKAFPGVFDLLIELLSAFDCFLAMRLEDSCGQGSLCWEVMMDARLLDSHRFGDVGVAKSRIPPLNHQDVRRFQNAFCRFPLHVR